MDWILRRMSGGGRRCRSDGRTWHFVQIVLPFGTIGLAVLGICSGIYVGGWIMALAEVIHVFPVFFRRIGLIKGTSLVIIAVAAGKVTGSMLHFFMRW